MIKHIQNENFKEEVLDNSKVVVVDFFATWCMPCKMLTPVLEKVSESRADFEIVKVDVDEAQELAMKYQIQAVPTLLVFKDGEEVNRFSGFMDEETLVNKIEESI